MVKEGEERFTVKVDPDRCILCGQCIKACVHSARTYRDDTERFFHDLEQGAAISVLAAPSLLTNYEEQYHNILGYLKAKGVRHAYNVSFGADLMTWAYVNFIRVFGLSGVISQSCPVIVNYLEKYKPELLKYLMPVQSPLMCTAIYVADYLKIKDKLAFISPCIAKKQEIDDVNTYERVSYNITFERLMEHIGTTDITGYYAEDEVPYGLGVLVPGAGGLSSNLQMYIGFNEVLIKTSGPNNIFPYFDHYYSVIKSGEELPFLVDAMSCTNGCYFGTGTNCGAELNNDISFATHRSKEKAYRSGAVPMASNYEERLRLLNSRFKNFALSSFVRQYDQTRRVNKAVLSEKQFEDIFHSMYKDTEEHCHVDCGSCGYKTCRDMAYAIGTHVNMKENCIAYSKERIRRETENTHKLVEEISAMNEELMMSDQMKSNFLANMSHEIRTPMNTVIGMAEMALRGELPEVERGYIQQIKSSGRSLLAIINDILDFSKIESGKMEINEVEYAVLPLIQDMIDTALTRIGERDVILVLDAAPDIPSVLYGDDVRIKQVIANLTSNAAKFTKTGYIRVTFSFKGTKDQGILTVHVADSGIGIRKEDMNKLFTSFQQLDSKRNRDIEGTGLGLAISKEFVRLMKGEIHVESVYGKGSAFTFSVPQRIIKAEPCVNVELTETVQTACLIEDPYVKEGFLRAAAYLGVENQVCSSEKELEEACMNKADFVFVGYKLWNRNLEFLAEKYPDTELVVITNTRRDMIVSDQIKKLYQPVYCYNLYSVLNHENNGLTDSTSEFQTLFEAPDARILVVDDNRINLTVAIGLLMPLKMKVDTATGAEEAVALLSQKQYDIVFMDHMMPGIDGVEATHIIRSIKDEYFQKLPIIALTANAVNTAKEMFISEGMNDFVAKPIDMVDITAKLRKWLPPKKIIDSMDQVCEVQTGAGKEETLVIKNLDVESGLAYTGSMNIYRRALSDYYQVIGEKSALIEAYWKAGDYKSYTIEVHALKSASRLVGAVKLADMAARLEKCGKELDTGPIEEETEELLRLYRSYIPILEPFCPKKEQKKKRSCKPEELLSVLKELCSALEDFDIDSAGSFMEQIKGWQLPKSQETLLERLTTSVRHVEYDEAIETAEEWQALLYAEIKEGPDGG